MSSASWQNQGYDGFGGDPAQPGAVFPLRRMTLGEVFGAGFGMLRHAPKAVLGISAAAAAISLLMSLLVLLIGPGHSLMSYAYDYDPMTEPDVMIDSGVAVAGAGLSLLSGLVQNIVLYVAFAFLAIPVFRAAYGYRTGFGQTLTLGRRSIGPLVLQVLALIVGAVVVFLLVGIVAVLLIVVTIGIGALLVVPGLLLFVAWLTAALMFSAFAVVVEGLGPMQAIARSWQLNRGRWWRHIGTVLLLWLMAVAASIALSFPVMLITGMGMGMGGDPSDPASAGVTVALVANAVLSAVISAVFTAVFGSCIAVMMLNARFEQESLDVVLMARAEGAHDDGKVIPGSAEHTGAGQYGAAYDGGQYGQHPYSHDPYGRNPYGQPPQGQNPYSRPPHSQTPYTGGSHGEPQWGQRRPGPDGGGHDPYRHGPDGSAGPR